MVLTAAPLGAAEFAIRFDRLPPAGSVIEVASETEQTGDLDAVLARSKRWGVEGKFRMTGSLLLRIRIDEVNAEGWATKAACQVVRCNAASGGRRTAADLNGKVFSMSVAEGKRRYLEPTGAAGESYVLDEPRASMLDLAVPLRFLAGEAGLDTMFGTAQPQQAKARWPADPQALAKSLAHLTAGRGGANQEDLQGMSVLTKATARQLTVESALRLSGLALELPGGYTLAGDGYELKYTSVLPADQTALPSEQWIMRSTMVTTVHEGDRVVEWLRETGRARYRMVK
jgi:hypothetical protein